MPIINLDYAGHYPSRRVEVSEEELARIKELTENAYIFDSEEGQQLVQELGKRPDLSADEITVVAYM